MRGFEEDGGVAGGAGIREFAFALVALVGGEFIETPSVIFKAGTSKCNEEGDGPGMTVLGLDACHDEAAARVGAMPVPRRNGLRLIALRLVVGSELKRHDGQTNRRDGIGNFQRSFSDMENRLLLISVRGLISP